ncbi:MAG: 2-hydroxyacid dehydrogenase [Erysipelotrichales bacterium]|nr:2-hydroxyacid dehydrogenase [Erysipelotrichales bacterium]
MIKILVYDAKNYDRESFNKCLNDYSNIALEYLDTELSSQTIELAKGYDAICIFVNCQLDKVLIDKLLEYDIRLVLLRCAGFNNVDVEYAKKVGLTVLRVPAYSPEAIAEHAMALALAVNRHIHKAYIKVRENNFSLAGLTGINLYGKVAGIIGVGKIGACMCKICHGFGMKVIAYDLYPNKDLDFVEYVSLEELFKRSDLISLHCPATLENYHLINKQTISKMKDGVILINTSRGLLVDTDDLIAGIRNKKFSGVGLDVYEEEGDNVFENREDDILEHSTTSRLLSFPNVIITSHQAFLTEEALEAIAKTTLENAIGYFENNIDERNIVK